MNKFLKYFYLVIICGLSLYSQEFTATVNKNPVTVGERFQISFALKNAEGSNFKAPDFKGFTVLSGPTQGQNVQIINYKKTSSISFSYILMADKIGEFNINPASISVSGSQLKSNPMKIKVLPESDVQKQQKQQEEQQNKDLSKQANDILKSNIFIKLNISKKDVFQGEQIVATYKLYANPELQIVQMNPSKVPSFEGFWAQELNNDNLQWTREIINGVAFNSATIKQVVLFPQKSGKLTAEQYEFDFIVRLKVQGKKQRNNDPFGGAFDDFFGSSSYKDFPYKAKSETGVINVKALPQNPPYSFNGAVGDLNLEAWLDKSKTKTGEPVALNVKISGSGNLKLIEPLNLNFPPGFEVYDPKVNDNVNVSVTGMAGSKIFEYLIIPRNPGNFKIDPVQFSYFDLNKKEYVTLNSKEFNLIVDKGLNNESSVISGVRKEDVQMIGKDIRFIKTKHNLEINPKSFLGTLMFWIWLISPILLFILFIVLFSKKRKFNANDLLVKTKRATKIANKRLKNAKELMKKNERNSFYEEITKAMWGYLSDKLIIPFSELTKDKAKEILISKNVDDVMIDRFLNTLDLVEFARYSPMESKDELFTLYNSAIASITELEGVLK